MNICGQCQWSGGCQWHGAGAVGGTRVLGSHQDVPWHCDVGRWGSCARLCALIFPYVVLPYVIHWFNEFGEPISYDTPLRSLYHSICYSVTSQCDPFSSSPFYTLVSCHAGEFPRRDLGLHYLLLFPEPSCRPDDHDMSDGSDPSCTCDSHVVGPDAKLNNDPMDVDVGVLSACKIIRRVPRPSIRAVNALAIVLSRLS